MDSNNESTRYEAVTTEAVGTSHESGRFKEEATQEIIPIPVDGRNIQMFSTGFMNQQPFTHTLAQHHPQAASFYHNQGHFYQNSLTHGDFYPPISTPISVHQFNSFSSLSAQEHNSTEECPSCGQLTLISELTCDPINTQYPICKSCCQKQLSLKYTNQGSISRNGYKTKGVKPLKKCTNCGTSVTTLWRKFKGIEEIRLKHPKKDFDLDPSPDYKGKTGCNACCLYWSLHGKHRPADMKRDHAPSRRKRKKEKSQSDHSRADIPTQSQYLPQLRGHFPFFVKQEDGSSIHSQSFVPNLA